MKRYRLRRGKVLSLEKLEAFSKERDKELIEVWEQENNRKIDDNIGLIKLDEVAKKFMK